MLFFMMAFRFSSLVQHMCIIISLKMQECFIKFIPIDADVSGVVMD